MADRQITTDGREVDHPAPGSKLRSPNAFDEAAEMVLGLPTGYERRIPLDLAQPCWPWSGTLSDQGYGVLMVDSQRKYAHRLVYQLHVAPIPRGWELDHACHSRAVELGECEGGVGCLHRACWNPAHIEVVTSHENSMRGNHPLFAIARSDTCGKGHDLTKPENVYIQRGTGKRRCRLCALEGAKRRRLMRRAEQS